MIVYTKQVNIHKHNFIMSHTTLPGIQHHECTHIYSWLQSLNGAYSGSVFKLKQANGRLLTSLGIPRWQRVNKQSDRKLNKPHTDTNTHTEPSRCAQLEEKTHKAALWPRLTDRQEAGALKGTANWPWSRWESAGWFSQRKQPARSLVAVVIHSTLTTLCCSSPRPTITDRPPRPPTAHVSAPCVTYSFLFAARVLVLSYLCSLFTLWPKRTRCSIGFVQRSSFFERTWEFLGETERVCVI